MDGSESTARAATVAYEVAELTESTLHIIHVIPKPSVQQVAIMSGSEPEELLQRYRANGEKLLEGYRDAASRFNLKIELILEEGLPSDRIALYSQNNEIDIIVMGSQGVSGMKKASVGSSTERVILGASCPVLVVK